MVLHLYLRNKLFLNASTDIVTYASNIIKMAFIESLVNEEFIKNLVCSQAKTHEEVSNILKDMFPEETRGLGEKSVYRFCKEQGLKRAKCDAELDVTVGNAVSVVRVHLYSLKSYNSILTLRFVSHFACVDCNSTNR